MKDNEREALRLLGIYTKQSFRIADLAGPRNVHVRAQLMSVLRGVKVPQNQSGINALYKYFYQLNDCQGCLAEQQAQFAIWAKENCAS